MSELPKAICAYPIPGWRLDSVHWDQRYGQPDGWIVSLKREYPDHRIHRRSICVMARSDVGPLEAWDEALKIAQREDIRDAEKLKERESSATQGRAVGDMAGMSAIARLQCEHEKPEALSPGGVAAGQAPKSVTTPHQDSQRREG